MIYRVYLCVVNYKFYTEELLINCVISSTMDFKTISYFHDRNSLFEFVKIVSLDDSSLLEVNVLLKKNVFSIYRAVVKFILIK